MKRRYWTEQEIETLRAEYPHVRTAKLAEKLDRDERSVWNKALELGVKKTAEYFASPDSSRLRQGDGLGEKSRFRKGMTPWNKGVKGLDLGGKETRFKAGHVSHQRPIGAERVDDGYVYRKVANTGIKKVDWVMVHVQLWEQHNGPVPNGHIVVFRDGNKARIEIDNLECITRAELMRRNTVHRLPKEIAELCQLRGALNRQINRRTEK